MTKTFRVTHHSGAYDFVKTNGTAQAALKGSSFPLATITSVIEMREPGMAWLYLGEGQMELTFESGAKLTGTEEQVNFVLGTMGFEPLAIRRNLTNGAPFIEPKNTPGYLSPASEAYWSA